jgi:sporulation protein YqfC
LRRQIKNKEDALHKKEGVIKKAAKALELPEELISGAPHIEMSGNRDVIIDGYMGIIEYDDEKVKLSAGKYAIKITGRDLTLKNMQRDSICISGFIYTMEFVF